jgi:hypothetical protein
VRQGGPAPVEVSPGRSEPWKDIFIQSVEMIS